MLEIELLSGQQEMGNSLPEVSGMMVPDIQVAPFTRLSVAWGTDGVAVAAE